MYTLKPSEETVNVCVIAIKLVESPSAAAAGVGIGGVPRWKVLEHWLKKIGLASDPLEINDLIDKYTQFPAAAP